MSPMGLNCVPIELGLTFESIFLQLATVLQLPCDNALETLTHQLTLLTPMHFPCFVVAE